ncbi:protein of unknown function [Burkholderia multivorans]
MSRQSGGRSGALRVGASPVARYSARCAASGERGIRKEPAQCDSGIPAVVRGRVDNSTSVDILASGVLRAMNGARRKMCIECPGARTAGDCRSRYGPARTIRPDRFYRMIREVLWSGYEKYAEKVREGGFQSVPGAAVVL